MPGSHLEPLAMRLIRGGEFADEQVRVGEAPVKAISSSQLEYSMAPSRHRSAAAIHRRAPTAIGAQACDLPPRQTGAAGPSGNNAAIGIGTSVFGPTARNSQVGYASLRLAERRWPSAWLAATPAAAAPPTDGAPEPAGGRSCELRTRTGHDAVIAAESDPPTLHGPGRNSPMFLAP